MTRLRTGTPHFGVQARRSVSKDHIRGDIFLAEPIFASTMSVMAHKKAGGSTQNGRDSNAKRRGVKCFGGHPVHAGEVLIRQKGFWFRPGQGTHLGNDWTIHASIDGVVKFCIRRIAKFNGNRERHTVVSVER